MRGFSTLLFIYTSPNYLPSRGINAFTKESTLSSTADKKARIMQAQLFQQHNITKGDVTMPVIPGLGKTLFLSHTSLVLMTTDWNTAVLPIYKHDFTIHLSSEFKSNELLIYILFLQPSQNDDILWLSRDIFLIEIKIVI